MGIEKRFFSKVKKDEQSGCWIWVGAVANRYGYFFFEGKIRRATHISLMLANRPIQKGMYALHKCDNPLCVNPDHLFEGSQKDNLRDAAQKKRCGAHLHPEKYKDGKPPVMKGEVNPSSKLTLDQVNEIRELYSKGGITQAELGRRHNVSQANISLIVKRKNW